ncbi:hypothetical protein BHM03_00046329 [Ensete ventricosum]|nr:hypothetical protein BHM03_00046329 [Ensete ventricosum]
MLALRRTVEPRTSLQARFAISTCTARYGRYIPVRQVASTRITRYRMVPPKIDHQRSIEGEIGLIEGEKGKKKRKRRKKKRRRRKPSIVLTVVACGSPAHHRLASTLACFFSRARRRNISPCGEKDLGDFAPFLFFF